MATSGNASVAVTSTISVKFSWWYNSGDQSIANNTTTVRWKMELVAGYPGAIRSSYAKNWKVSVNGTEYSGKNYIACEDNQTINLASGTTSVPHNEDGTKTFSFTFYQEIQVNFSQEGLIRNVSGSGSGTLGSIERKSTLTTGNGTLGTAQTLAVAKKASSFTHTITYKCGSASGTIATKSSSTSISWTPPINLAEQQPQGTSVAITFTIQTFSGSTSIGTSSATSTYAIPESVVPYFSYTTTDAKGFYDDDGTYISYLDFYGSFIQGWSAIKMDITAGGEYGAWVTSIKTTIGNNTYSGESVTTGVINTSGSLTVTVTVTDSRGRTAETSRTVTVLTYAYPNIKALTAYRSNEDGSSNNKGSYMTVKFSSGIYSLNTKNGAWYKIQYKRTADENHTEATLDYTGEYIVTDGSYTFAVDESSYDIVLLVGDRFKTVTRVTAGPSLSHVLSFLKKNGQVVGMAVGKVAELEDTFDVGWTLKVAGGDSVIEQGTSGDWTYRKWYSGVMECWRTELLQTAVNKAWGSMYVGATSTSRINYPFPFITKPVENVTVQSGGNAVWVFAESGGNGVNGAYASAVYNVCRPSAVTAVGDYYLSFHVVGMWK